MLFGLRFNLLSNLLHLGNYAEAEEPLQKVRALADRLGQKLDLIRTRWLEGLLAAGLGKRDEAIAALEQVREDFNAREIPYDAALVTLELATLYLAEGRTGEVRRVASELKWIFKAEGIEREALAAVRLFYEAAEQEALTVELARRMASFLYRAQHDPELRFEALEDVSKGMPATPRRKGPTQTFRVEANVTQELDRAVVDVQLFDHPRLLSLHAEISNGMGNLVEVVDARGHLSRIEM